MQNDNVTAFDQPIIPLSVINNIIAQLSDLYSGKFPIRNQSTRRYRSHARKRDPNHIPRPQNPFFLFRTFFVSNKDVLTVENKHQNLSKIVGEVWKYMTEEDKRPWNDEAERVKEQHRRAHPEYTYSPSPVTPRSQRRKMKKGYSEEEKKMTDHRCVKIALEFKKAMPGTCESTDSHDISSDTLSASGICSSSVTPSPIAPSPAPSPAITANSNSLSPAFVTDQDAVPIIVDVRFHSYALTFPLYWLTAFFQTTNILPSKRNSGIQRTPGWIAQLDQQSLSPPSQATTFPHSSTTTMTPASLINRFQQTSNTNIWSFRSGSEIASSSSTSPFGTSARPSTSAFGQSGWNIMANSGSSFASTSKNSGAQMLYDDSDEEFEDVNYDDFMVDDSDLDDWGVRRVWQWTCCDRRMISFFYLLLNYSTYRFLLLFLFFILLFSIISFTQFIFIEFVLCDFLAFYCD